MKNSSCRSTTSWPERRGPGSRDRTVVTTTVAAAQCRRFLEGADAEVELVDSIAAACRRVADAGDDTTVALTSAKAARLHSLAVLRAAAAEDHSGTATRMALTRRLAAQTGHDRTVIVVTPIGDRTGVWPTSWTVSPNGTSP